MMAEASKLKIQMIPIVGTLWRDAAIGSIALMSPISVSTGL
jgi:hypothetical protein